MRQQPTEAMLDGLAISSIDAIFLAMADIGCRNHDGTAIPQMRSGPLKIIQNLTRYAFVRVEIRRRSSTNSI